MNGVFKSEDVFVACGFDKVPFVFKKAANGSWVFDKIIDEGIN